MNLKLTISPKLRVWSSVESRNVDIYKQIQEHVMNMRMFHLLEALSCRISLASQLSYVLEETSGEHDI